MTALPAGVLARLRGAGVEGEVRPARGGRSARTFVVDDARSEPTVVVRLRAGTDRLEQEARATALAHRAGVGPEVLDVAPADGALVTRFVAGDVLTAPDLRDPVVLDEVATALRRLLGVPAVGHPDCDPVAHRAAYLARAIELATRWDDVVLAAEERSAQAVGRLLTSRRAPGAERVLCHGDLVPGNLVRTGRGVTLLDLEYAGVGEAAFDLANLVVCGELDGRAARDLVRSYCGADEPAVLARVEDWAEVLRHAWYVWVALGEHLGSERAAWTGWAARVHAGWAGPGAPE